VNLEILMVHDGAVCGSPLDQNPADRRRRQRQPKYRIQIRTSIKPQPPMRRSEQHQDLGGGSRAPDDRNSVVFVGLPRVSLRAHRDNG
jgi:hypothetical protein